MHINVLVSVQRFHDPSLHPSNWKHSAAIWQSFQPQTTNEVIRMYYVGLCSVLLLLILLCFLILAFVCGKQPRGWWSICDGRTDVRLEFWNVLKRNIPGLLSCFQAVSSYLRLCYSAGAQKARRPHEKQIGLYWLFLEMLGALNPFRPSVYQTFWNQCEHMWCAMV